MRIILDSSVSTVKRLRVSLGTLIAIEATVGGSATALGAPAIGATAAAAVMADSDSTAPPPASAEAAIARAFDAIDQINRLMHPTAEGSDLARINQAPLHTPTKVHPSVGQLLNLAKRINTLTEGVFDPCTPAHPGRLRDIEVSADETEVICHAPVALDFGGFAKGYAVDCAIEALMASGCISGLVNAGGDLRVFGQRDEPVFMRGPGDTLTNIELSNAALAVTDPTTQRRPPEHRGYYIRDTAPTARESQLPNDAAQTKVASKRHHRPAAVVADTAVIADAMTKCVLLCPPAIATRTLSAFNARRL